MVPILMDINIYHHFVDDRWKARLSVIIAKLGLISTRMDNIMATLAELTAQVTANSTVIDSAVVLIQGIAARIEAAGTDPVKLQALADELKTKDDALSEAVAANTEAVPLPPDA